MRPALSPRRVRLIPDEAPGRAEILTVPDDNGRPVLIWLALAGALLAAACGGRPFGASDGGATPPVDSVAAEQAVPGPSPTPVPTPIPAGPCVIAIRVDICCATPQPVLVSAFKNDPCLLPYPAKLPPKTCLAKWPKYCDLVDCAIARPPTRTVGLDAAGKCIWKSECETGADCMMAIDARHCCPCALGYPRNLLQTDLCLVEQPATDDKPYPPPGCQDACGETGMKCEPCPAYPPIYPPSRCEATSDPALKICAPWWD